MKLEQIDYIANSYFIASSIIICIKYLPLDVKAIQSINDVYLFYRFAQSKRNGDDYFILLIITDGIITDMPQTCEAIVNVSANVCMNCTFEMHFETWDIIFNF